MGGAGETQQAAGAAQVTGALLVPVLARSLPSLSGTFEMDYFALQAAQQPPARTLLLDGHC